jgi:histone deacetylase 1/2
LEDRLKAREDPKMHSIFKINQSFDCPGFEGLYNFCQLAAGGSIDAADLIITGQADIVINWAGGFHHAKKT